jgi:hypothetical protein
MVKVGKPLSAIAFRIASVIVFVCWFAFAIVSQLSHNQVRVSTSPWDTDFVPRVKYSAPTDRR